MINYDQLAQIHHLVRSVEDRERNIGEDFMETGDRRERSKVVYI